MDWLTDLLPSLRCPDTHQSLRLPTEAEIAQFPIPIPEDEAPAALITEDGTRLYLIDRGIPVLLPGCGLVISNQ